jgi:hypothetical protein
MDQMSADDPGRAQRLGALAAGLQLRFSSTGRTADLESAIATTREALSLLSEGQPGLPLHLSNLGNALRMRYEGTGRLADLEEAVSVARQAVQATAADHSARGRRLSNLGFALRLRFERTGRLRDLDEAIEVGGEALALAPDGDPSRARLQSNLGIALRERYEQTNVPLDLQLAADLATRAAAGTPPDHPDRAGMMSNLAVALYQQYESGGTEDLALAITAAREALGLTPDDHPDRALYAMNLSVFLRAQAAVSNDVSYLDEGIASARHAVDLLPEKHPGRADSLSTLGRAHRLRYRMVQDPEDACKAIDARRQAAAVATAPAVIRALAARAQGEWAMEDQDPEMASGGYTAAVGLLAEVAWHGLERSVREGHLAQWRGLPEDAAACTLRISPPRAVELLEQGRTVLWTQRLHHRTDLRRLNQAAPNVADRLGEIRAELDRETMPRDLEDAAM